jgi:hypothetical protein
VTTSRKLIAAVALILPLSAMVAAPAAHAASQKAKHHSTSVHKASAHKGSHKKHSTTPSS